MKKIATINKHLTQALIAISFFAIILTSCQSKKIDKSKTVALVNDEIILKEDYENYLSFYQKFYIKLYGEKFLDESQNNKTSNLEKLQSDIIDSMIKDKIMISDLNKHNIKVSKNDSVELIDDLSEKLLDNNSLIANINSFGAKESEFEEIIYNDSIRKKHFDFFKNNTKVKNDDIVKFFNNNEYLQTKYKYDVLIFDDKFEANKIRSKIKNSSDFKKYLTSDIKNYSICKSEFVYSDDKILELANIFEKNKVSKILEYKNNYYILMINSKNNNKKDLLNEAKEIYLKNEYEKYLKRLIKNSNIKLFI